MNVAERLSHQEKVGLVGIPDDFSVVDFGMAASVMADLLKALKDAIAALQEIYPNPAQHGQINHSLAAIARAEASA